MYRDKDDMLGWLPLALLIGLSMWGAIILAVVYWPVTIRIIFGLGIAGCSALLFVEFRRGERMSRFVGAVLLALGLALALNMGVL